MMTAPRRELTTSPLQQLFVMNSPFMQERAAHLVKRVNGAPDVAGKDSRHVSRRGGSRPDSEGTGHGADLSGQRNAGSIRSGSAGVERGDFLAMISDRRTEQTFAARLDRVALRRPRLPRPRGHALRRAASRRGRRSRRSEVSQFSRQGQTQHRALHGGRALAVGHVRSQARAAEVSGTAAALRSTCAPSAPPAACCPRRSSSSSTGAAASTSAACCPTSLRRSTTSA